MAQALTVRWHFFERGVRSMPISGDFEGRSPSRTLVATAFACLAGSACGGGSAPPPINHAPTATSASITTTEDTSSAPVTPSVTDSDASDTFTFSIVTTPGRGSASVVTGKLVYTPDPGFSGQDSFTYRATDS